MDTGEGKFVTPPDLPFPREISFKEGNLNFLIDLDRLQIRENNLVKLESCSSSEYTKLYFDKLPHTPVFTAGVNFNFTAELEEKEKIEFYKILNKEKGIYQRFSIEDFILKTSRKYTKDKQVINQIWELVIAVETNCSSTIRIAEKEDVFVINNNFQVSDLQNRKEKIKLITEGYDERLLYHRQLIENLFKGLENGSTDS